MQPSQEHRGSPNDRPGTPPRPPYSPVTPVLNHLTPLPNNSFPASSGPSHSIIPPARSPSPTSQVAPQTSTSITSKLPPPPVFTPEPPPVPISESENPDAIALRSAISILQLQKQQSLRDIQSLERLKKAAAEDPEGFARELAAGNLSAKDPGGYVNFTHDEEEKVAEGDGEDGQEGTRTGLGAIPTPQNVVRMPPINWAKYQIVGDPLDRMHEDQRRRPFPGEPRREDHTQRAPEHILASPYRPLVDKLETPSKVKGTSKSKKT
ncbi:hypothetical protein EYZ11_006802 [Aspergillus tanneri]|nr:hypothetical protein EYZ11_006802 [Aspergillus tanneri]